MRRAQPIVFALAAACWTSPGAAETVPPVSPATVVPDLSFQPTKGDVRGYSDYFYFHKDGVTFAAALADIEECSSYSLAITPFRKIPDFVPIGGAPDPKAKSNYDTQVLANSFVMWGIVGSVIAGFVVDDETRTTERSNTRRCMGYLGYRRYGLPKSIWSQITKGSDEEVKARLALIASGPKPRGEVLEP
jgi:hypothetical protein